MVTSELQAPRHCGAFTATSPKPRSGLPAGHGGTPGGPAMHASFHKEVQRFLARFCSVATRISHAANDACDGMNPSNPATQCSLCVDFSECWKRSEISGR